MKVYCRFAPPAPSSSAMTAADAEVSLLMEKRPVSRGTDVEEGKEEVRLLDPVMGRSARFTCHAAFLPSSLALHNPTGVSDGVFDSSLPLDNESDNDALNAFVSEQAHVYARVCGDFVAGCNSRTPTTPYVKRNVLLAYGQTSSGKTHTLFGSYATQLKAERRSQRQAAAAAASHTTRADVCCTDRDSETAWWEAQLRSPTAGLVPRFLAELFDTYSPSGACLVVDISCWEIYNEVTTDLVAVAAAAADGDSTLASGHAKLAWPTRRDCLPQPRHHRHHQLVRRTASTASHGTTRSSTTSVRSSCTTFLGTTTASDSSSSSSGDDDSDDLTVEEVTEVTEGQRGCRHATWPRAQQQRPHHQEQEQQPAFSLAASRRRYLREEASATATTSATSVTAAPKTTFKSTEKGQVLGHLQRLRCGSAGEAWAVLHQLLALRRRAETERNASSSRGHLLLRVEASVLRVGEGRTSASADRVSETLFCDLAGSESHRRLSSLAARAAVASANRSSSLDSSVDGSCFSYSGSECTELDSVGSGGGGGSSSRGTHRHRRARTLSASLYRFNKNESQLADEAAAQASARARETRGINASLLALRKVIHAFHLLSVEDEAGTGASCAPRDGGGGSSSNSRRRRAAVHAPFKESALTTILEPFLLPHMSAGRGESSDRHRNTVALIICCSSRQSDFHETISSLRFGAEASSVKPHMVLEALPRQARRSTSPALRQAPPVEKTCCHSTSSSVGTQTDSRGDDNGTAVLLMDELHALRRARVEQDRERAQLTAQFADLCAHYKESVEALAAARAREEVRDDTIARLTARLAEREKAREAAWGVTTPWTAGKAVELSPNSTVAGDGEEVASSNTKAQAHGSNDGADGAVCLLLFAAEEEPAVGPPPRRTALTQPPPAPSPSPGRESAPPPLSTRAKAQLLTHLLRREEKTEKEQQQRQQQGAAPPLPPALFAEVTNRQRDTAAATLCKSPPPLASHTLPPSTANTQRTAMAEGGKESAPVVPTAAPCRVYKL